MNKSFLIVIIFLSLKSYAQKGIINKYGFFKFHNSRTYLAYLDYCLNNQIAGNSFLYLKVKYNSCSKYKIIILSTDERPLEKFNLTSYSLFHKRILFTKSPSFFNKYVVDEKSFQTIKTMSEKIFFTSYIDTNGVFKEIKNEEVKRAVIYRLLLQNVPVSQNDISGELQIPTNLIDF
ncbi:MAG: hypothetical protein QM530_11125 [Phycisphaerales bacterium]|nr:hypothetical protein [Phycisphaerales bacterium]